MIKNVIPGEFHLYHAHIFPMISNTKETQESLTVLLAAVMSNKKVPNFRGDPVH